MAGDDVHQTAADEGGRGRGGGLGRRGGGQADMVVASSCSTRFVYSAASAALMFSDLQPSSLSPACSMLLSTWPIKKTPLGHYTLSWFVALPGKKINGISIFG